MVAILYGVGFVMEPVFLCLSENGCKRAMKTLSDKGKIERKGGKRFGYREVK